MAWLALMAIGVGIFLIGLIPFLVYDDQERNEQFRDITAFIAMGDAFFILAALIRHGII